MRKECLDPVGSRELAERLAKSVQSLATCHFTGEALLVRLVVAGLPLRDAVTLEGRFVRDIEDHRDGNAHKRLLGREFDPFCRAVGLSDLRYEILNYTRRAVGRSSRGNRYRSAFVSVKERWPRYFHSERRTVAPESANYGKRRMEFFISSGGAAWQATSTGYQ